MQVQQSPSQPRGRGGELQSEFSSELSSLWFLQPTQHDLGHDHRHELWQISSLQPWQILEKLTSAASPFLEGVLGGPSLCLLSQNSQSTCPPLTFVPAVSVLKATAPYYTPSCFSWYTSQFVICIFLREQVIWLIILHDYLYIAYLPYYIYYKLHKSSIMHKLLSQTSGVSNHLLNE